VGSHGEVVEADTLGLGKPDENGAKSIRGLASGLAIDHTNEGDEPRNAAAEGENDSDWETNSHVQKPVSPGNVALVEVAVCLVCTRRLPAGRVGADACVIG
jgi:hypothetical protein